MARLLYGHNPSSFTTLATGAVAPLSAVTVWDARVGGSQVTDLETTGGSPVAEPVSDSTGLVSFFGPDGFDGTLWLDGGAGSRLACWPAEVEAVGGGAGTVVADLAAHEADTANPHAVTKAQVGLGNVDNTADAAKPISTAQQAALDAKADTAALAAKADTAALTAHQSDVGNPHAVSAAQVGLGNVDNTADSAKPVSTAQQTALDAKADASALTAHTGDTGNPHSVTKAQVGLGSVDNTADTDKPVSTAQQAAIDAAAATGGTGVVVWPGSGGVGSWPSRPSVGAGVPVEWWSVLDDLAPIPTAAVAGDVWMRAPGAA